MTVKAITRIEHGNPDGSTKVYEIGDSLDGDFSDDELRSFIEGGSAVEVGKDRKFTATPAPVAPTDQVTEDRDTLIAESLRGTPSDEPASPAAEAAAGTQAAGSDKTVSDKAAEKK